VPCWAKASLAFFTRLTRICNSFCFSRFNSGRFVIALDLDAVLVEARRVELEGVVDQCGKRHGFDHARHAGIRLLHGHDGLDVVDVLDEREASCIMAPSSRSRWSARTARKSGRCLPRLSSVMNVPRWSRFWLINWTAREKFGKLRFAEPIGDERGRNIDAVKDVADVVQHSGGDLRHSVAAGSVEQLVVHAGKLSLVVLALGDVDDGPFVTIDLAVDVQHGAGIFGNPDNAAVFAADLRLEIGHKPWRAMRSRKSSRRVGSTYSCVPMSRKETTRSSGESKP